MSLRFEVIGRVTTVALCTLLACSEKTDNNTGVAGASNGGTSTAGTSGSGSGGAGSNAGGMVGVSGSASGGTATAGSGTGGTSSGGISSGGTSGSGGAATGGGGGSGGAGGKSKTTFFVTSDTRTTGKLGPLETSDKRCQDLAAKAGIGDHTFHAYLSTSTVNAKDRIGTGPWVNSAGVVIAADLAALHSPALVGNPDLFIDENKMKIHGQWDDSKSMEMPDMDGKKNEHDIFTGSKADGTVQADATCKDWTSDAAGDKGQVGHSDGMGPSKATTGTYPSWNSSHASSSCAATWMAGGAGRIYCFAID
jgi:hypothetical protein